MWQKFSKSAKKTSWKVGYPPYRLVFSALILLANTTLLSGAAAANVEETTLTPKLSKSKSSIRLNKTQKLVQEVLEAYGGEAKFKQVYEKGCHGFGTYTQISSLSGAANTFDLEIFNKGDKIREEMNVLGEPLIGGFDGKHSWLKQYGEVIEDNPAGQDLARQEIEHGLQVLFKFSTPKTKFDYIGIEKDNSYAYEVLKITTADGVSTVIYIDKKTHLISRTEFIGIEEEQGLAVKKSFVYEDYRPFLGSIIPFKMTEYSADKKVSETALNSIKEEPLSDALFQAPPDSPPLLAKNGSVTIPFQLIAGEIIIDVALNGKMGYSFVVDTGATQSLIDTEAAPALGQTKESNLSITTGGGNVPMSYMKLKSLLVGCLPFADLPVVVADLGALKKIMPTKNLVGMLGANIMRQFIVTFDFPNSKITFANPDNALPHENVSIIPAKPSLGGAGMMIAGELDGKKIDCLIDTGAAYSLIPYELAKQIGDRSVSAESMVHGLDGKPVKVAQGQFKALKLGDETIAHPSFFVAFDKSKSFGMIANGSVAILGNPTWKNYAISLDYKRQKVVLAKSVLTNKK
jgi:predicted aspartyl protease